MRECNKTIDLRNPVRSERVRGGFQPHWRTVFVYRCPECGAQRRVRASSYLGSRPVPGVGGIVCGALVPETAPVGAEGGGAVAEARG